MPRACFALALLAAAAPLGAASCEATWSAPDFDDDAGLHLLQRAAAKAADVAKVERLNVTRQAEVVTTTKPLTASSIVGVEVNSAGDLDAFKSALFTHVGITAACTGLFLLLRRSYPSLFQHNTRLYEKLKEEPLKLTDSLFSPLAVAWKITIDDIAELAGLDHALMVLFSQMTMRMMLLIGIPHFLVLVPLFAWAGGNAAKEDRLSHLAFGNVGKDHWICWPVAVFVWYVVLAVQHLIFRTHMIEYIPRRRHWLMSMPLPRSNTVLVQSVPDQYRSQKALSEFFSKIFGDDSVTSVCIVRDTTELLTAIASRDDVSQELHEAEFAQSTGEAVYDERVAELQSSLQTANSEVDRLRLQILASEDGFSGSAFVTFKDQQQGIMALSMRYTGDDEEFVVSIPPDPADVRYGDLQVEYGAETFRELLGYGMIAGLFFGFIPIVAAITNVTTLTSLAKVPVLHSFFSTHPTFAAVWDGLAASLGLTLFMSFLPTFLSLIFSSFFALKADAWLQHKLQQWYFYFLLVFVLLVTAVGASLWEQTKFLIDHPTEVFKVLAATLPTTTHFYLKYVPMQWGIHAMNLTRYINLIKYLGLRGLVSEERARELSEPEDQDYYGMGSRSARHTLVCLIGVVLCTLSPLITPLVFVQGFVVRGFYSYLIVYAETRKTDLGGVFWCTQMNHLQQGLLVYIILMTGVLLQRASSPAPGILAGSSAAVWWFKYHRFRHQFNMESLPLKDMSEEACEAVHLRKATRASYEQPELLPLQSKQAKSEEPIAKEVSEAQ
eukprot:gb/GFBE01041620.1/.p1 GENE.gb/GFBE01041620.1/~~gb/GFBE01041620.1/.p1  ORF type:complete len:779 (+),score=146.54 gb/GFBE01041620.1/:1-2337(+)